MFNPLLDVDFCSRADKGKPCGACAWAACVRHRAAELVAAGVGSSVGSDEVILRAVGLLGNIRPTR